MLRDVRAACTDLGAIGICGAAGLARQPMAYHLPPWAGAWAARPVDSPPYPQYRYSYQGVGGAENGRPLSGRSVDICHRLPCRTYVFRPAQGGAEKGAGRFKNSRLKYKTEKVTRKGIRRAGWALGFSSSFPQLKGVRFFLAPIPQNSQRGRLWRSKRVRAREK